MRECICCKNPEWVFVFGSNERGRHGLGAALHAAKNHGAVEGVWHGPAGLSYAITTKDSRMMPLPLDKIATNVIHFLSYAASRPKTTFFVTAIGTGLAGYKHSDIAPMFKYATRNCILPFQWEKEV